MKIADVLSCSFSEWYKLFNDVTEKSVIIPLPDYFIKYLHADGVVLPESASHGIYVKASNLAMDGEDDDEDLRDEDLLDQYEADWSTPDSKDVTQTPDFKEFDEQVQKAIKTLGGRVFPKLNWSSPKDATWISFDKTLMCTCPSDVYLLLKSSEFVAHDLDMPFSGCEDQPSGAATVQYVLVLRRWQPPDPSTEFRVFVHSQRILAISQRDQTKFYKHIKEQRDSISQDIHTLFDKTIRPRFSSLHSYVFDVIHLKQGSVKLVDLNPYGPVTDGLMYTWEELDKMAAQTQDKADFRCVVGEDGVKCSEYANYAMPQDIQDLTSGQDPYKMMDFLKLKEQQGESSSDSSADEGDTEHTQVTTGTNHNST